MKRSVAVASGSNDTDSYTPRDVALISDSIKAQGINVLDVIKALAKRGFREEAQNLLNVVRLRVSGDYLQTAAVVRDGHVISAVNDPNDYVGPGTGYRLTRCAAQGTGRDPQRSDARAKCCAPRRPSPPAEGRAHRLQDPGTGGASQDRPNEIVIGVSPAFGVKLYQTLAGHPLSAVLRALSDGIRAKGCVSADRAHAPHRRHLVPRPFGGAPCRIGHRHRHPGQGHGGDSPGRPPAASQSRAVFECPDHHAGALPIVRARTPPSMPQGEMPEPVVVPDPGPGAWGALPRPGRLPLCDRDLADRGRRAARGHRDQWTGGARHERRPMDAGSALPIIRSPRSVRTG